MISDVPSEIVQPKLVAVGLESSDYYDKCLHYANDNPGSYTEAITGSQSHL